MRVVAAIVALGLLISLVGCRTAKETPRQQIALQLMPSEQLLDQVKANLQRGMEAVGGTMTITSQRILFRPHSFNIQSQPEIILFNQVSEIRSVNIRVVLAIEKSVVIEMQSGKRYGFIPEDRDGVFQLLKEQLQKVKSAQS